MGWLIFLFGSFLSVRVLTFARARGFLPDGAGNASVGVVGTGLDVVGVAEWGVASSGVAGRGLTEVGVAAWGVASLGVAGRGLGPVGVAGRGLGPVGVAGRGLVPWGVVASLGITLLSLLGISNAWAVMP